MLYLYLSKNIENNCPINNDIMFVLSKLYTIAAEVKIQ